MNSISAQSKFVASCVIDSRLFGATSWSKLVFGPKTVIGHVITAIALKLAHLLAKLIFKVQQ